MARRRRRRKSGSPSTDVSSMIVGLLVIAAIVVVIGAVQALGRSPTFWVAVAVAITLIVFVRRRRAADAEAAQQYLDAIARERRLQAEQRRLEDHARVWPESLTWQQLEELTAELLRRDGWDARVTEAGSDRGIDVLGTGGGVRMCAQCKQQWQPVGAPKVQQFVGALVRHRAHRGVFVSPSGFTVRARAEAAHQPVTLVDRELLLRWLDGDWWFAPPAAPEPPRSAGGEGAGPVAGEGDGP